MSAFKEQIQGNHYLGLAIQPVEYNHKNKLGFCEGCVVKYVTRWRDKGGLEDLKKAKHFIELLIEMEGETPVEQGKVQDGETVRVMGEWVKVSAPSQVPMDLTTGDELEEFNGNVRTIYGSCTGLNGYHCERDGAVDKVFFDEISAYRRKS